ncbi:MAG: tRNA-intron lyase [Halobacteriota archaeon]
MEGHRQDDTVRVGGDARQRFHDARGYGRVDDGAVVLSNVEAAHLLFRNDLDAVDGLNFRGFFEIVARESDRFPLRFLVYADLRERGFYLSPARNGWVDADARAASESDADLSARAAADFVVYPRGQGPRDGVVEYVIRVVGERNSVAAASLSGTVLAVVDEESDITYLKASTPDLDGTTTFDPPESVSGALLADRVVCWNPPESLYERGFYGRPLSGRDAVGVDALQLSLVEAASLVSDEVLDLGDDDYDSVVERGRAVEGERFDRRLKAYATLRRRGVVPKTGYKFGADFRTYASVESVESLGHSEHLVRVVSPDHSFAPRDLSLDVRLAGGVRKRMVFALTDLIDGVDWLSVTRLTP